MDVRFKQRINLLVSPPSFSSLSFYVLLCRLSLARAMISTYYHYFYRYYSLLNRTICGIAHNVYAEYFDAPIITSSVGTTTTTTTDVYADKKSPRYFQYKVGIGGNSSLFISGNGGGAETYAFPSQTFFHFVFILSP